MNFVSLKHFIQNMQFLERKYIKYYATSFHEFIIIKKGRLYNLIYYVDEGTLPRT